MSFLVDFGMPLYNFVPMTERENENPKQPSAPVLRALQLAPPFVDGKAQIMLQWPSEIREWIRLANRPMLALLLDEFCDQAGPAGLM